MGLDQRDGRTPDQVLRSVLAYLQWRAGDCWRNTSYKDHRQSTDRWDYLSAWHLVQSVRFLSERPELVPALSSTPRPDPEIAKLAMQPRAVLVDELMQLDPTLTSRRMLSHLAKPKLAAMLLRRYADSQTDTRRTA